jgi:phage head maturation protease
MSFMFSVTKDEWSNLDSDYPTRHIKEIGSIVEVSAVTFPAYEATENNARSNEALENAKMALENARRALGLDPVDTGSKDKNLELLKLKTQSIFLGR